jgi:phage terminase large subunit
MWRNEIPRDGDMEDVLAELRRTARLAAMRADGSLIEDNSLVGFIEKSLKAPLWSKQREIAQSIEDNPRTAVRSAHACGKSFLAARVVLGYLETHPHSIAVTTAPTSRQVRNVLWRNMRAAAANVKKDGVLRGRMLTERYDISEDWYAIGFKGSDNNSDATQGFHSESLLVVVDEAAGVAESVMEGLEAILTGAGSRLLLIGNPTSMSGTFRRAFHEDRELYNLITISAYDTPNFTEYGITREDIENETWREKVTGPWPYPALVDPGWVERQVMRFGMDSPFIQSRVDAEFPVDDESVLISLADIDVAVSTSEKVDPLAKKYVGIDVSRSAKGDETVMCLRQGQAEVHMEWWPGNDLMESAGRVRSVLSDWGFEDAEIRVDVVGVGAGLADRLREAGLDVVDVNVASASSDKTSWRIFRHEAWWQLAELYRERQIWPAEGHEFDARMIAQLTDIRKKFVPTYTKPEIESKDETKKRTGWSPDRAEAQMLAYCVIPLPPKKKKFKKPSGTLGLSRKARSGWYREM